MSEEDTHKLSPFETLVLKRFDQIDARLDSMDVRLQALETKAYDTKPIWEQALAEILEVKAEMLEVKERLQKVEDRLQGVEDKLSLLNEDMQAMRGHQRRLEKRVSYLEEQAIGFEPPGVITDESQPLTTARRKATPRLH